ncbi:MAG: carboxypeptidase-like regulatory domain-containing protein [Candidatus Micrarchaeota archaeon]
MLEEFFESVNEKWQGFLEWCADKGLPLKDAADWLEEKGLPSLPVFLLILLLIFGGAAFLLLGGTKAFEPKTADVTVTLLASDGLPVSDARVFLADPENAYGMKRMEATTGSDGVAYFSGAPVGAELTLTAAGFDGSTLTFDSGASSRVSVGKKSENNLVTVRLAPEPARTTVSLALSVEPPPSSATFWLFDTATYVPIADSKTGATVTFDVQQNTAYKVVVQAEGFNDESRDVRVDSSDKTLPPFGLTPKQSAVNGRVIIRVTDSDTREGIGNATIEISEAGTGKTIFRNLKSGADGGVPSQEIKLGTAIYVSVKAAGYPAFLSAETEVQAETGIDAVLRKVSKEQLRSITVAVFDSDNRSLSNPSVWLHEPQGAKISEEIPSDGVAVFKDLERSSYYVTVYKYGFLPARIMDAEKGKSYSVRLEEAGKDNSAKAVVEVTDKNGEFVPSAYVSLSYLDGLPTGVPEKYTSADGTTGFDGLPLDEVIAVASAAGRNGSSLPVLLTVEGTGESEDVNLLHVLLMPAPGKLSVKVRDHFTNKTIDGARVEFSPSMGEFAATGSCTTSKGACSLKILEGFYAARVEAEGYDDLLSSEFEVKPGVNNKQEFELMPVGVLSGAKLVFQGAYDLTGNKASSLSPSTVYNLRFVLSKPPVSVSRIQAHIRIGNEDSSLESETAEIVGYGSGSAVVRKGTEYSREEPTATVTATPTPTPAGNAAALFLAGEDVQGYKFADFTFQPFEGTREVSVQIRTRPLSRASVNVQYRAAFYTSREILRDPVDSVAGPDALSAATNSVSLPLSFGGICEGEVCLESHFEGRGGTVSDNYAAESGETFSLKFTLAAPRGAVIELTSPADDLSLSLEEGVSGDSRARARKGDEQAISLTTSDDNAAGTFSIRAQRLSNDVPLTLQARFGESTVTRNLAARVVGTKPDLKVSYSPKSLQALADGVVTFKVSDSLGLPVKDASVVLGDGSDALRGAQVEGVYTEGRDGSASYRAEGIRPVSVGYVSFKIDAEGFKSKRGTLLVSAVRLVEVDSTALALAVESRDPQQQAFSVNNLLEDSVPVTMSLQFSQIPKYTRINVDTFSLRLKARQSGTVSLTAEIDDAVLQIAERASTVSEKINGRIRISARLGGSSQEEYVPFTVKTSFVQQELGTLWQVSSESLQFALQPPKVRSDMQSITVTNDAPYPLLVNQENTLPRIFSVEPLSVVVPSGGSAEFRVYAKAMPVDPCETEPDERNATLKLIATTQGVSSKRQLSLTYSATSSDSCSDVGSGGTVTPTPLPEPSCALTVEPSLLDEGQESSVTVAFSDFSPSPNSFEIECGNGRKVSAVSCSGESGSCSAKCRYPRAGEFTVLAVSGGVECTTAYVEVQASRPSCALTIDPSRIKEGEFTMVTANYYNLARAPNALLINCGNGRTANAAGCSGTTGTCQAKCYYEQDGTYAVQAAASGTQCSAVQVDVLKPDEDPLSEAEPQCVITADPTTLSRNQNTLLTISYYDLPKAPNVFPVNCGNGRTVTAKDCTGTTGSCSIKCSYPAAGTYKATTAAGGSPCSSDEIEVSATEALPDVGEVKNGVRLALPVELVFQFPKGTLHKENPDGTEYVELPSGDSMLFEQGAQVGDLSNLAQSPYQASYIFSLQTSAGSLAAIVPAGAFFQVPPAWARKIAVASNQRYSNRYEPYQQPMADTAWELRFPVSLFMDFEPETEFTREGSLQTATVEDFDITIPASIRLTRQRDIGQRRASLPSNTPFRIQLTPFVSSRDAYEVYFPVEAVFLPQEFVRVKRDEFNGNKALQFRSGTTISLPADAVISTDSNDFKKITIPAGSAVRMPSPFAQQDPYGRLSMMLPFRVMFRIQKDEQVSVSVAQDGFTVSSISNDRSQLSFYGVARKGLKLPDSSYSVDVLPYTQMSLGPAEFGVYGSEKEIPAGFSLSLAPNVNVRNVPTSDAKLVEFANGARMLAEGASSSAETPQGTAKLEVHAGSMLTMDRRILKASESVRGQESFTVAFPAPSVWHFPRESNLVQNRIATTSYEATFPAGFTPQTQRKDSSFDVLLAANQPITFTTVDPELAMLQGMDFEFTLPFDVGVSVPQESLLGLKTDYWKDSPMESVRLSNPVTLTLSDPQTLDRFEADATRIMSKRTTEESFGSDPLEFTIPDNTLFVLRIAPTDMAQPKERFRIKGIFSEEVTYTLPATASEVDKVSRETDFNGACLSVQISRNGRKYGLKQVRKVIFPPSFRILTSAAAPAADGQEAPAAPVEVLVPKKEETVFVLCEKQTKGSMLLITDEAFPILLEGDLTFTFNNENSHLTQSQLLCVKNEGSSNREVRLEINTPLNSGLRLSGPQGWLEGPSIVSTKGDLDHAVKSITKKGAWLKELVSMRVNERNLAGEDPCPRQSFEVEVGVPEQFLDEYGCLKPEAFEEQSVEGKLIVFGVVRQGTVPAKDAPIRISFVDTGKCLGNLGKQLSAALNGFYVNYQQGQTNAKNGEPQVLVFKDVGHKRWLSMTNNYDEDLSLSYAAKSRDGSILASCDIPQALKAGTGYIAECTAEKAGEGFIEIRSVGAISTKPEQRRVAVIVGVGGKPLDETLKEFFPSSPMGDLVPQQTLTVPVPELASTDDAKKAAQEGGTGEPAGGGAAQTAGGVFLYFETPADGAGTPENAADALLASDAGATGAQSQGKLDALAGGTMQCQTNFCTGNGEQLQDAYKGFGAKLQEFVLKFYFDEKYPKEISTFCNPSEPRLVVHNRNGFYKSIIVQSANTRVSFNELQKSVDEGLGELRDASGEKYVEDFKWDTSGGISSCGIYIVTARLGLCKSPNSFPDKKAWLRSASIEMAVNPADPTQFKACEETLANAGLLTAEDPQIIVGREQVKANTKLPYFELRKPNDAAEAKSIFDKFKLIYFGSYRGGNSELDERNAQGLISALYGSSPNLFSYSPSYSDAGYCTKRLGAVTGSVMAASAPNLVIQGIMATFGVSYALKETVMGFASTLALCGSTSVVNVGNAVFKDANTCDAANACAQGASYYLLNTFTAYIPNFGLKPAEGVSAATMRNIGQAFSAKFLGARFASEFLTFTAFSAVFSGVEYVKGDDKVVAKPDLVLPAGKAFRSILPWGSTAWMAEQGTRYYGLSMGSAYDASIGLRNGIKEAERLGLGGDLSARTITKLVAKGKAAADFHELVKVKIPPNDPVIMDAMSDMLGRDAMEELFDKLADDTLQKSLNPVDNALYQRRMEQIVTSLRGTRSTKAGSTSLWADVVDSLTAAKGPRNGNFLHSGPWPAGISSEAQYLKEETLDHVLEHLRQRGDVATGTRKPFSFKGILKAESIVPADQYDDFLRKMTAKYPRLGTVQNAMSSIPDADVKFGRGATVTDRLLSRTRTLISGGNVKSEKPIIDITRNVLKSEGDDVAKAAKTTGGFFKQFTNAGSRFKSMFAPAKIPRLVGTIVAVLGPILTYADLRPVRAELDYRYGNHVVVFNNPTLDNAPDPVTSVKEICTRDEASKTVCLNRVDANALCPRTKPFCFYFIKGPEYAGVPQYDLLTAFNGRQATQAIAESFFAASKPVQTDSFSVTEAVVTSSALPGYSALEGAGVPVSDEQSGPQTPVPLSEAATNLLARYKEWCDGYQCPPEVVKSIEEAEKLVDQGNDAGYRKALEFLNEALRAQAATSG